MMVRTPRLALRVRRPPKGVPAAPGLGRPGAGLGRHL
jgi:hypothetical protein